MHFQQRRYPVIAACLFFALPWFSMAQAESPSRVQLNRADDGSYQLLRNGQPYPIKGAGFEKHLPELVDAGANSVRTWGADKLGQTLDQAQQHGLTVCAGLWLGHPRHGFDYRDKASVEKQLQETLAVVRKYKDHPALLLWGVGNEMEGDGKDPLVWKAVNEVAKQIKVIDPNHPTMTVIAELGENENKVHAINQYCPDIDVIGINSYGGIESVGDRYLGTKVERPYIVTEHGPLGPWEVGKTAWGSPLEFSSTEKADWYRKGYQANAVDHADRCLGTYAFLWGYKQETTATWFGMLLPGGLRLAAADTMAEFWTGKAPRNRCPEIQSLTVSQSENLKSSQTITAAVEASDPESDDLKIEWVLRRDSVTIGEGGDKQNNEAELNDAVVSNGSKATITMPKDGGGAFRLFAYVKDGNGGAAVANVCLQINELVQLESAMPISKLPYTVFAEKDGVSVFVPSGYMGSASDVAMDLECSERPHQGKTCIKASYNNGAAWGGVLWQSPAGDWEGEQPGGANLSGAKRLEFWARGQDGGEVVNFVFGVLGGKCKYRDTAKGELKDVKLTSQWKKYSFPLDGLDLRQIKTGFGWSLAGQGKPVTFYLDDIKYVAP